MAPKYLLARVLLVLVFAFPLVIGAIVGDADGGSGQAPSTSTASAVH
jgi:hypothetical protein